MSRVPFDRLPAKYEPDVIARTLEVAFAQLEQATLAKPAASPTTVGWPSFDTVSQLSLRTQAGTYGGALDPRVAYCVPLDGKTGLRGPFQRFRFPPGTELVPLFSAPLDDLNWRQTPPAAFVTGSASIGLTWGRLVVGIPHGLGRLPEFIISRSSADDQGPRGQKIIAHSGTIASGIIRCDMDFIPILGIQPRDIERGLKHVFAFGDGATPLSEHSFDDTVGLAPGSTSFENPPLARRHAADMVTTRETFSGLLLTTVWGLPAWAQNAAGFVPANTAAIEVATGLLRDPVTGRTDQMGGGIVASLGKVFHVILTSSGSLQSKFADGTRLQLSEGSVDFIMG